MDDAARTLDAYLVAGARLGDSQAFARLAEHRGPRLLAHARRLTDDVETAKDVVQEAWVGILRGLTGLRDDRAFLPWALRIVTRAAQRDLRGRIARRRLERDFAAEAGVEARGHDPAESADAALLRKAIALLPRDQAAALALFYLEDLDVAEVAVALDAPVGTIKTRLMHGRAKLRALLDGDDNGQA